MFVIYCSKSGARVRCNGQPRAIDTFIMQRSVSQREGYNRSLLKRETSVWLLIFSYNCVITIVSNFSAFLWFNKRKEWEHEERSRNKTHTHKQAQSQTHIERQEFLAIAVDKFRSQGRGEGYLLKELLIGIWGLWEPGLAGMAKHRKYVMTNNNNNNKSIIDLIETEIFIDRRKRRGQLLGAPHLSRSVILAHFLEWTTTNPGKFTLFSKYIRAYWHGGLWRILQG